MGQEAAAVDGLSDEEDPDGTPLEDGQLYREVVWAHLRYGPVERERRISGLRGFAKAREQGHLLACGDAHVRGLPPPPPPSGSGGSSSSGLTSLVPSSSSSAVGIPGSSYSTSTISSSGSTTSFHGTKIRPPGSQPRIVFSNTHATVVSNSSLVGSIENLAQGAPSPVDNIVEASENVRMDNEDQENMTQDPIVPP